MSRLTRDGTAEPASRDQILRHARGQGNIHFPCSADHEQDWQHYPVDPYSAICDDHTYIHTYIQQPGHQPAVANSARGQLNRDIETSLSLFAPKNFISRDRFGRPVLPQQAHFPHPD